MTPMSDGFLLSLSLCMDIGVVNIAMITLAMQRGYWPGFWLGLGSCVGDLIYAVVALIGVTALLQFTPVRWVMWIGGGIAMAWFAAKMMHSAWTTSEQSLGGGSDIPIHHGKQLLKGMLLALSSPSALIWFAVVGGALIARSGRGDWDTTGLFLTGFFTAGLVWTLVLCALAAKGRALMGHRLLKYSYWASALLFIYFAYLVIVDGYDSLILRTTPA